MPVNDLLVANYIIQMDLLWIRNKHIQEKMDWSLGQRPLVRVCMGYIDLWLPLKVKLSRNNQEDPELARSSISSMCLYPSCTSLSAVHVFTIIKTRASKANLKHPSIRILNRLDAQKRQLYDEPVDVLNSFTVKCQHRLSEYA